MQVEDINGSTIAEYYYDPFGRRLWKEVGGTRSYFFYADEGLVAEYDAAGNESTSYGYKPDSTWTTDPLWLKQNGEYSFYQNDHLGTPQKLVKQNEAVVWSASYSAFGQARVEVETVTNNLCFPGQYFDAETGVHYNFHRYYAPRIGRYLRNDPIGLKGGINIFSYAFNNPLVHRDQFGLAVTGVGIGGSIALPILGPIAAAGSGSCMIVWDDRGSKGIACCVGVGAATGGGFVAGVQGSYSKTTESICDLQGGGFGVSFGGGGGIGYGAAGEVSVDPVYGNITGGTVIAGVAQGGFAGSATAFGGCLLLMEFGNTCEKWRECEDERDVRKRQKDIEIWLEAWQSRR